MELKIAEDIFSFIQPGTQICLFNSKRPLSAVKRPKLVQQTKTFTLTVEYHVVFVLMVIISLNSWFIRFSYQALQPSNYKSSSDFKNVAIKITLKNKIQDLLISQGNCLFFLQEFGNKYNINAINFLHYCQITSAILAWLKNQASINNDLQQLSSLHRHFD